MLQKWVEDVVGAREIPSELRAYLVGLVRRFDSAGMLHISAPDALEEGRHGGEVVVMDGVSRCGCGRVHRLDEPAVDCVCGAQYLVEWTASGCRVVGAPLSR